ncbi:MAG: hypothetical protein E7404_09165 [Ruminococcaceae bacterium]|nr:hypothetical protein [Oscillospiraceae bacterium]
MFGYVRVYKDELKVKEYELFRAYYCGLCKTLKKDYCFAARMGLSYDLTFLSILFSSVSDYEDKAKAEICIANPIKKKPVISSSSYMEYAACANVILTYFKILDDFSDNHSIKSALAYPFILAAKRKARKKQPELYKKISQSMKRLSVLEKSKCNEPDKLSNEFGFITQSIFSYGPIVCDKTRRILGQIGYHIGRFIYLLDACDDYDKDKKNCSFNVLLQNGLSITKEEVLDSLEFTLSEISSAYNLLEIKKNKPILDNIIYLGLMDSLNKVRNPIHCKKETKNNERPL